MGVWQMEVYSKQYTKHCTGKNSNIPQPEPLQDESKPLLYMIVADDAFPLKDYTETLFSS